MTEMRFPWWVWLLVLSLFLYCLPAMATARLIWLARPSLWEWYVKHWSRMMFGVNNEPTPLWFFAAVLCYSSVVWAWLIR